MADLLTYSKGGEAAFGWVQSQNAVLETMQAGATLSATTTGTFFRVGMSGSHFGYQAFFAVDLSGLPSDAVIRGGYFYLSGQNDGTTKDFIMQVRRFDWGPTVTTADWRNATQAAACPLIAALDSSAYSGSAMLFPISDPSGLTPGQVNGFIIVSDRFISGTHPVNSGEYVNFDDPGVSGGEVGCTLFYEIADPVDPWVEVPLDMTDEGLSSPSGVTTVASWQPFAFDPDKYAGEDVSYYFEAVIEAMHGTLIQTWNVKNLADNSICASVSLSPLLGSGLYRVPFTPAAGRNVYAIEIPTGPSAGSNLVTQARIVVRVVKPTKLRLQVPLVTEKRDLSYYQKTQLGVGAGTPWKVLSEPLPALWRKDSSAWAELAGATPWTFEAVLATAGTKATLYNVTDDAAVASSELTCDSASPTLYSASFADDAAGFHDGDDFDVRVSSTTYIYAARLFVDLQAPKDFELLYRYGRSRSAATNLSTALDKQGRVRPRWAGILSAADTVALYNELSGYCADDAEVAFLADVGTSRLVRTDPAYSERAGINFNSATKARRRVALTGLDDGDCALMTIHGTTANALANHALLVVKVNGFRLGPEWANLSLEINGGAASTDDNDVTLTIHAEDENGDPPDQMRLAEDDASAEVGDIVWGDWEPYVTSRSWRLAAQTDDAAHARGVGAEFRYSETGEPEAPPEEEEYGCLKPETTSTLTDYRILGGTHDIEFDHVLFDGYVSGVGSYSTTGILISSSYPGDVHDIAFRNCVFATCGYGGGISNAFHAILTRDEMYNITFDHCWFEPASRICTEFNGRGGWWHDLDMSFCTFEGSCGEQFSCDMSPGNYDPNSPYGVNVGGVVRGVEGLSITDCLFEGTGATVGAYSPASWLMGLEFGCVYPYASNNAVGRSEFKRNKVGRCASSWLNFSYPAKGCHYMTFEDNVFDFSYNDHNADAHNDSPFSSGSNLNYCTFDGNTYVLGAANNQPYYFVAGGSHAIGGHNTFVDEHWTKPSGSIGSHCEMPFTDSTYTGCHFHLPKSVTFPASASGSGCEFDNGSSGGTFT